MEFQGFSLHCFRQASEHRSIRKAAEVLSVSPSSVHRQIVKLEKQLDSKLFDRSSEGVRLTAAGEVFSDYVQRTHHDLDRMVSEIEALKGVRRGQVRVACEEGLGKDFLPEVLASFRRQFAGVRFVVRIMDMPGIVAGVVDGSFDVGIAFNPQSHASLKRHAQAPVAVGAVMLPGHPLSAESVLRLADLVDQPIIVADDGFTIRHMLDVQVGSARRHLDIAIESNSFEAITSLVKSGAGVAIRTLMGIASEVRRGEVVFVPISEPGFHMETIAICTKVGRPLPVAAAIFVERLVAALADLADSGIGLHRAASKTTASGL